MMKHYWGAEWKGKLEEKKEGSIQNSCSWNAR
jgi:hypothetical protein